MRVADDRFTSARPASTSFHGVPCYVARPSMDAAPLSAHAPKPSLPSLDSLRFLCVTGKGGVGKSTVAVALARAMAARGRRVLVAMCNAKERLSTMVGSEPVGWEVTHVAPNIDAVNMLPQRCVEEYGVLTLKSRTLYRALFENKYVESFLRAVPGLYEWSMLGKAWWHTTELLSGATTDEPYPPPGDGWKYETVILDAPATGHGLDMLRVPKVILDIAPPGILRRDAERAWRLFQEPTHAGCVLVTLPEEMPTNETIELAAGIRAMNLPIPRLVVNCTLPPLFDAESRALIGRANLGEALHAGRARARRESIQEAAIARLSSLRIPTAYLPYVIDREAGSPAAINELARYL